MRVNVPEEYYYHTCSRGRCARPRGRLIGTQAGRPPFECFQLLTRSSYALFRRDFF